MPDHPISAERLLTLAQVAELLTLDVDDVLALLHEGRLRGTRLGTAAQWRIEQSSVGDYVDDQIEETRRMHPWHQSNAASFPELWGTQAVRHRD